MSVIHKKAILIFWTAVVLAFCPGRAGAQPDPIEPYGKIVKEIRLPELKWTKGHIILRELASRVGEVYTRENAEKDLKRLDQLDLFASFDIRAITNGDQVILELECEETNPRVIFPAISSTDENGLSIGAGFRTINLRGLGVTAGANARFGGQTSVGADIQNPWVGGLGNHFGLRIAGGWVKRRNEVQDFDETSVVFAVQPSAYMGDSGRVGARLNFQSLKSDDPEKTLSPDGRDILPSLAAYIGLDTRDVWSDPKKGWQNELEVSKTFGDADYWTFIIDLRRYQTVKERHTLFASSLTSLRTGQLGVEIPSYHVFTFGGVNSVRGWEFNQRRGKNQFLNTVEYRYDWLPMSVLNLFGRFRFRVGVEIVGFGDFGVLWDEGDQFAWDNFIGGYGVGLRLLLPGVSAIRLDFGWGQSGAEVVVGFGVFRKADMQRRRVR
jgi:outer membrane protein insertion porin family